LQSQGLDPETVKIALSKYKASENRKRNVINDYTQFLKMQSLTWGKPKCKVTRKFPFIPLKKELDTLIAGAVPKHQHSSNCSKKQQCDAEKPNA
jgi:hypothetical protein